MLAATEGDPCQYLCTAANTAKHNNDLAKKQHNDMVNLW